MGKQVKDWTPPTDAVEESVTEPVVAWTPPTDAVVEEPVKKKGESSSLGSIDFITQQRKQFEQPIVPSEKPTKKSTPKKQDSDEGNQFIAALRSMAESYKQPANPADARPDYLVNAVKRGLNLADQANIIGPFAGKPDAEALKKVTDLQKQTAALPASDSYNKFTQAKSLTDAVTELAKDPAKIIVELTGESLASMAKYGAPRVAAGAALGAGIMAPTGVGMGPGAAGGALVGMADTSYGLEFTGKFMESLQEAGVDVNDPKSLEKAFSSDEIMEKAKAAAYAKGAVIGLFDLVSGGIAGKIVSKPAKSIMGKIGAGALEFGTQAAFDAGGEVAGQAASGEDLSAGSALAEVVGGLATTPAEIALGASTIKNDVINAAKSDIDITDEQSVDAAAEKITTGLREPSETPREKASREIDALVVSGDVERDGKKVKILTEKGGQEITRIYGELEKEKVQQPPGESDEQQQQADIQKNEDGTQEAKKPETGSVVLDQPESKRVSGIKKALVPNEVVDGTEIERRNMSGMLDRAKDQVTTGQINPKAITDEIANGNARALQPDEVGALVYYKTQIDNRADQLNSELIDAIENKDEQAQARLRTEIDAVNQEVDAYNTMAVKTAYEQSLAFNMRKMLLDNEYNLQSQINKYKATNNGQITTEVEQKFKDLDQKLKDTNAKLKKLEEKQSKERGAMAMGDVRILLQKQKEKRVQAVQQKKAKINAFFDSIKVKSDPNKLNSITQVIGESVYNGSVEAVRAAVLAGADLTSALQAGVEYVKEHYRGTDFDENAYSSTLRPGLEALIPADDDLPSAKMVDGKLKIPTALIKQMIDSGMDDINTIVDGIYDLIKDQMPDVSKREIRDAITAYGQTRYLSQEEINVKLREIKRMGRLVSQLEDVQNKQRPLRSGLQRDKLTDEERRLQRQVKEGMKDIPVDPDEEARAWKNSLDSIKSRLKNQIADLERQIETGEKTPKKKGTEYDDEAKSLQERRDELKAVVESIEGKPKMSDEQRLRQAVTATGKQIAELERKLSEKDTSKTQRAPLPESQELKDLRAKRDDLRSAYKEMEKELGIAEASRLAAYKKALQKSAERYEQRLRDKEFTKEKPKPLALDEEATKLKLERDKIKQDFDLEQEKARMANRSMGEKVWDTTMDVWNLPKSFLASIDMSAPFRQGAILSLANPTAGAKSFGEMFRQAFSEKKATEWLLKLRETPEYAVMRDAKLYLAEPTTKLTAKEESFLSNLAGKIPLIGPLVKGSERAYTGYLNKLRVDVFAIGADQLRQQGITPESNPDAYKSWANFINNATGRGNLGGLEMAAPVLNGLFFSPRYVVSRLNLLNPVTYGKMPAPVRKMAMKNMIGYIGFGAITLALFSAAGADVELDPRSSDFGKIRFGDTRYDIWAGFQQPIRLLGQLISGQRKSTKTGEITELNKDKFPYETRADVALRFGRSKLSPSAGTVANLLAGETIVGEDVTIQGELVKNAVPLYLQDMKGIYEEEGVTGLTETMIPAFFGIGVQSYSGKSGLENKELDTDSEIQKLNKSRGYTISQPTKSNLTESLDHEVDDELMEKFFILRDKEIKRQFDRYKGRLDAEKDIQIYDKLMDQIVKEAGRHAKYQISREKGWRETAKEFNPGEPFRLKNYKKNEEGKVVPR
jgi:hypothetical protein